MLCCLFWMTLAAVLICWHEQLLVIIAVTDIAANRTLKWLSVFPFYTKTPSHFQVSMRALLPILYNCRSLNGMTKNALFIPKYTFSLATICPIMLWIIPTN